VLSYDDKIVVGTSYNPYHDATLPSTELATVLSNAFDAKQFSTSNCIGNLDDDSFHNCRDGIWYNHVTKSIIFDPEDEIDLDGNVFSNFYNYLVGAVSGLFGVDVSVTAGERILVFANRTRLFNNLYVSKHGDQMIKAVVEDKQTRPGVIAKVLTATYEGFDTTICDSVRSYSANAVCSETDGKEVVLAIDRAVGPQQFSELVLDLTRRTRVE
jgi:hypothetical protein